MLTNDSQKQCSPKLHIVRNEGVIISVYCTCDWLMYLERGDEKGNWSPNNWVQLPAVLELWPLNWTSIFKHSDEGSLPTRVNVHLLSCEPKKQVKWEYFFLTEMCVPFMFFFVFFNLLTVFWLLTTPSICTKYLETCRRKRKCTKM